MFHKLQIKSIVSKPTEYEKHFQTHDSNNSVNPLKTLQVFQWKDAIRPIILNHSSDVNCVQDIALL